MKSAVQRDGAHSRRPDARRWVDEETTCDACKTVSKQLHGERSRDLVANRLGPRLVKILGQNLHDEDVGRVQRAE